MAPFCIIIIISSSFTTEILYADLQLSCEIKKPSPTAHNIGMRKNTMSWLGSGTHRTRNTMVAILTINAEICVHV